MRAHGRGRCPDPTLTRSPPRTLMDRYSLKSEPVRWVLLEVQIRASAVSSKSTFFLWPTGYEPGLCANRIQLAVRHAKKAQECMGLESRKQQSKIPERLKTERFTQNQDHKTNVKYQ